MRRIRVSDSIQTYQIVNRYNGTQSYEVGNSKKLKDATRN